MSATITTSELDLYRAWIARAEKVCTEAAGGNLEARLLNIDAPGDLGRMLHSINTLLDSTDCYVRESQATMQYASHDRFHRRVLLNGMLGSFRQGARHINDATDRMTERADALRQEREHRARIADQIEASIQAAVGTVVSSAGRLEVTAESVGNLTLDAVAQIDRTKSNVAELSTASTAIGSIVTLIRQVAGQTNLLALNATIEAARAGEAGKGFSVVAGEVKELSRQTASATDQIEARVKEIRSAVILVLQAISEMNDTVRQINTLSRGEQATQPGVTRGTEGLLGAASELSGLAETLRADVEQFVADVRG